jgi:uncharacterized protein YjiS (DUF1127 family)
MFCTIQVYQRTKPMPLITLPFTLDVIGFFSPPARARRFGVRPALVATVLVWRARRRTRQRLATLDDRALTDIGLTRAQQRGESAKPFWES